MDRQSFIKLANELSRSRSGDFGSSDFVKEAMTEAFFDELEKIAYFDPAMFELLKEAGFFSNVGGFMNRTHNAVQANVGKVMTGQFGHATEHAAQKLNNTASPAKAALIMATDPHVRKAVVGGAKKVVGQTRRGVGNLAFHTQNALTSMGRFAPVM